MNLAKTMNQQGQLQPILVRRHLDERDRWIIVAGERRWRAAGLNGWTKILAIEHRGDHEVARLIENLQRVDLTAVEEARGLNRLITEKGWTQAEAGEVIGIHRTNVSALLRILTLPGDFLEECVTSHVPRGVLIEPLERCIGGQPGAHGGRRQRRRQRSIVEQITRMRHRHVRGKSAVHIDAEVARRHAQVLIPRRAGRACPATPRPPGGRRRPRAGR